MGTRGRLHSGEQERIYDGPNDVVDALISGNNWLILTDEGDDGSTIYRRPTDGSSDAVQVVSYPTTRYYAMFADPDSGETLIFFRRNNFNTVEIGFVNYDDSAGTITPSDAIDIDRGDINTALGSDYMDLNDVYLKPGTIARGIVSGILEGDSLYLLLSDVRRSNDESACVLIAYTIDGAPGNRTLTIQNDGTVPIPFYDGVVGGLLPLAGRAALHRTGLDSLPADLGWQHQLRLR